MWRCGIKAGGDKKRKVHLDKEKREPIMRKIRSIAHLEGINDKRKRRMRKIRSKGLGGKND